MNLLSVDHMDGTKEMEDYILEYNLPVSSSKSNSFGGGGLLFLHKPAHQRTISRVEGIVPCNTCSSISIQLNPDSMRHR